MSSEDYYMTVLMESGLSKAEIDKLVKETIAKMKNLINEKTALFILAKQRGLVGEDEKKASISESDVKINELKRDLKNVNVVGKISEIGEIRSFHKENREGYVGNFWLKDKTGEIRVVLWDDKVNYMRADNFKLGEIVRVQNCMVRQNKNGQLELSIGQKSDLELNPSDVDYAELVDIKDFESLKKLNQISLQDRRVSVEGTIILIFEVKEFTRKGSNERGKLQRITIQDDSATMPIVFWNEDVDKIRDLKEGDFVRITKLRVKTQYNKPDQLELHATNSTDVIIKKSPDNSSGGPADEMLPIAELQNKEGIFNVAGKIIQVDNIREINFKSGGEKGYLLSFILSDSTGAIRVTLWRDLALKYADLKAGEELILKRVLVRKSNFSGLNEITVRTSSEIIRNAKLGIEETVDLPIAKKTERSGGNFFTGNITPIKDIDKEGVYEIKGYFTKDLSRITIYEACSKCRRKVENCICEEGPQETEYNIILNLLVDDTTGVIRVTFIGAKAEKLLGYSVLDIKSQIENEDHEEFLKALSMKLIGKEVLIRGKAKYNDYSENYEIVVFGFKPIVAQDEINEILDAMN
ncbi:MAG: OB-fold nucleic acid binding domain-containing protein [Promethearchaeota archaeon]